MADGTRGKVEAAAEALGIQLDEWQIVLSERILEGGMLHIVGARRAGRTSVLRVVDKVRADSPGES